MGLDQYIPNRAKKYIKVVYDPVYNMYFNQKYNNKNHLVKNIGPLEVEFDTSSNISKEWFYPRYKGDQIHEPVVSKYLADTVKKDDVFFDVGANVGYFSAVAAASGAETHSFEVDPRLGSIIYTNLEQNSDSFNVVVGAVSDRTSDVVSFTPHQSGNPSTNQIVRASYGFSVPTLSLDSYVSNREVVPNLMKIDVEGAEADVVLGGDNTLACEDLRAVLLEIHPKLLNNTTSKVRNIYSTFIDHGFDCYRFQDHRSTNLERKKIETSQSEITNLDENQMLLFSRS